jgi:hypothetical protein
MVARVQRASPAQRAMLLAALLDDDLSTFDRLQRQRGALALDSWCWPAPLFHAAVVGSAPAAAVEAVARCWQHQAVAMPWQT